MKIVMDTKNNTAAPSGSISTPMLNQVSPVGSQGMASMERMLAQMLHLERVPKNDHASQPRKSPPRRRQSCG